MLPLTEKIETAFRQLEPLAQVYTLARLESMMGGMRKPLPVPKTAKMGGRSFVAKWAGRFTVQKTKPRDLRMQALKKKHGLTAQ